MLFAPLSFFLLISGCSDPPPPPEDPQVINFTEITQEAGLGDFKHFNGAVGNKWYPEQMGSGAAFLDYNNDGWSDIILLAGGHFQQPDSISNIELFINKLDGTFEIVSEAAGLDLFNAYTIGLAIADYDNDGDQDLFLNNLGRNMLLNNHDGTFTDVAKQAGLAEHWEWGSAALFFDADRDGHLDLYAGNYVQWTPETDKFCPEGGTTKLYCIPADYEGNGSRYFHNNGDGTFSDQTETSGLIIGPATIRDKSLGVAELDINDDGWSDFIVVSDGEADQLYLNNQDGTFTERGTMSGIAFSEHGEARAGMGVDVGVVDSSQQVTMFVGNFSEETVGVYKHVGNNLFMDRSAASKIGFHSLLTLTFGLLLFDADLDADLDLFTANGHVYPDRLQGQDKITFRQPSQLYLNNGDGTFAHFNQDDVFENRMVARGAAYADIDHDGDLDLLITENDGPAHLWRNDTAKGNVLQVSVQQEGLNPDALGTRVVASLGGYHQERRRRTGSSYLSQSDPTLVFGLGNATQVDTLWVHWPDGEVARFLDVAGNRRIKITRGQPAPKTLFTFGTSNP